MTFQVPVTVESVLRDIQRKQYLLPAIQREFVWRPHQILALVDSLMRGYPVGSFLMWKAEPTTAQNYVFYDFITDFHERDSPFANKAVVPPGTPVTAVLDGQQRLTSLNVALFGSYAEKRKGAWKTSAYAYPKRRVHLNLAADADHEELGLQFDLRFLTDEEAKPVEGQPNKWFPIRDVLRLENSGPALMRELSGRQLINATEPFERLFTLYEAFRHTKTINYYEESDQSGDKVLDIFVRVNSGGTTLSYSDLLLSMATNQWRERDAREEVRELVHEINSGGSRDFRFSKDVVLKSALMISGVSLQFRVANFTRENMAKVEASWELIERSLYNASALLAEFGYNSQNLSADSVIMPVAYYLSKLPDQGRFTETAAYATERESVRRWVARSLLKQGIWGAGLDSLLTRIRTAIDTGVASGFPEAAIDREMSSSGQSLKFSDAEIDELLDSSYGGKRTFVLLSLLYPGLDFSKQFHQDHVFPKSRFTPRRLASLGLTQAQVEEYRDRFNLLPNLQLLSGPVNVEKLDSPPDVWIANAFPTPEKRAEYLSSNDLDGIELTIEKFIECFGERRERMRERLRRLLVVSGGEEQE